MKKFEAPTLQEAYENAAKEFGCSLIALQSEVIQYPSNGILGIGKKNAIIVASCDVEAKIVEVKQTQQSVKSSLQEKTLTEYKDASCHESIDSNFYETFTSDETTLASPVASGGVVNAELALHIENQLKELFSHSCFLIDVIEVDVIDKTALIFIDGEDAALLIGKEGYRYNALSYMIFNWLFSKYDLFVKLEIARFLTSQQEMIRYTLRPTIESVHREGKAKTRPFDGILAQIALEQLRAEFPNKYVAIKTNKDGERFVVVNDFLPKH